jgi:3-isopropylmalate/(R)-2-methylmalate dehydratase small subunit
MNRPFVTLSGLVVPIARANIDTDAILPKQFMKSIRRTGFGENLFDSWRYLDRGEPGQDCSTRQLNPDFPLNRSRYAGAEILLAGQNFGCGSSREHALWALTDFGIRAIVAPSFADIFYSNCFKNGVLPVALPATLITQLFAAVDRFPGYRLHVDLPAQAVTTPEGVSHPFNLDLFRKRMLLEGLDEIEITLREVAMICAYEQRRIAQEPWLFPEDRHAAPPGMG